MIEDIIFYQGNHQLRNCRCPRSEPWGVERRRARSHQDSRSVPDMIEKQSLNLIDRKLIISHKSCNIILPRLKSLTLHRIRKHSCINWRSQLQLCVKSVHSRCDGSSDRYFMVDPLSYFSFHPVLHYWCNKGNNMCYPVCMLVYIKEPLNVVAAVGLLSCCPLYDAI